MKKITYVGVVWNGLLDTLALSHFGDNLTRLGGWVEGRATGEELPMVEDGLGESLTTSGRAEIGRETEGLVDREVSLDGEERSTGTLLFGEDVTTSSSEDTIDTTHGLLWDLDFDQEDGFEDTGVSQEGSGQQDSTGSTDDLTATTVNGIGVKGDVLDVEANSSHWLFSNWTFAGSPLETRDERILDFVEVLDGLGLVNKDVGTRGVWTETPDLTGISDIPFVLISEKTGTSLDIVAGRDLSCLNSERNLLTQWLSSDVETVVLVLRLGQGNHAGLGADGLTIGNDGVRDTERNTSVIFLKILQANFQMKFTSTGNNVLTRLVNHGQDTRVRLGETLETFDKLGQIVGVLDLDGSLDDGRDGELHDLQVVGGFTGGEGTRLEQELVDTNETDDVTSWDILNGLDETAHHENGTLDSLDEEIILLSRSVVRTLDTDLKTGADGTREDTTESIKTSLIGGWHHLRDVKHKRTLGVAVTDTNAGLVISWTFVQGFGTVLLGSNGRWEVEDHHLKKSVGSGKELSHDNLEQWLALKVTLLRGKLNLKFLNEGGDLVLLGVSDGVENLEDGVQNELVERTLEGLALILAVLGPLLGLWVEVVVSLWNTINIQIDSIWGEMARKKDENGI